MARRLFPFLFLAALSLMGAQCIRIGTGGGAGVDGGVFKTANAGDEWARKVAVPSVTGSPRSIAGVNVLAMTMDPQDRLAVVVGTRENGLLYTFDGGETWNQPSVLSKGLVNAIAVDPREKCTIYAASANRVVKTTDCYRSFTEMYRDPVTDSILTGIVVAHDDSSRVYAVTSKGTILRSDTAGHSWTSLRNFGAPITDIVMNPNDSRVLYIAIPTQGVWKSSDAGQSWTDLLPGIKKIDKIANFTLEFQKLAIPVTSPNSLLVMVAQYGLLRSDDGGASWKSIKLLTEPSTVQFFAIAAGTKSDQTIYYNTASTFYRTFDGGATWETRRLPSTRPSRKILVDPANEKQFYIGVATVVTQ